MRFSWLRCACLLLALSNGATRAGAPADFNAAFENVVAHDRTAIGYLRAGHADRALLELTALRAAWRDLGDRFAGSRPHTPDAPRLDGAVMTDISTRLVAADLLLKSGHLDAARRSLEALRADLRVLRVKIGPTGGAR